MANRTSQSMPNNPRVKKYLLRRPNEELFVTSYHSASSKNPCWAGIVRKSKLNIRNYREVESKAGSGHWTNPQYIYVLNNVRNGHTHPSMSFSDFFLNARQGWSGSQEEPFHSEWALSLPLGKEITGSLWSHEENENGTVIFHFLHYQIHRLPSKTGGVGFELPECNVFIHTSSN